MGLIFFRLVVKIIRLDLLCIINLVIRSFNKHTICCGVQGPGAMRYKTDTFMALTTSQWLRGFRETNRHLQDRGISVKIWQSLCTTGAHGGGSLQSLGVGQDGQGKLHGRDI